MVNASISDSPPSVGSPSKGKSDSQSDEAVNSEADDSEEIIPGPVVELEAELVEIAFSFF